MRPLPALSLPLHSETHGVGGDPLLLLHGFGTNGSTWSHWVPELSRDHRVVVVEMKGFGHAPKPRDGRYSPLDQAELIYRLILQQGLLGLTLIGHSLGGGVALLVALRLLKEDPLRLKRMVVVAGTAFPQPLSPWIRLAGRAGIGPLLLKLLPGRMVIRKALELAYARPTRVTRSQVEAYAELLRTPDGRYALVQSARQLVPPGIDEAVGRLGEIHVPTLLLWGERDRIVPPRVGERLSQILPASILEILPDCGHMPQEEQPREALSRVRRFLQEAGGRSRDMASSGGEPASKPEQERTG